MKKLTDVLNSKYPIICGPMAWTSMSSLVGAVTNAGGFGVLGVGFAPNEIVAETIKKTQAITDGDFAINVTILPGMDDNIERVTKIALDNGIRYIYADNAEGLNKDQTKKWFDNWHEKNMIVITKIATVAEAKIVDEAGADVIIAKGREGGGHMTKESTITLVPQVVDMVKNGLVVASGGIADGRGYAAAMAMGAVGIEMGTVFMAATEGDTHENVKNAVVNAIDGDVVETGETTGAPCWQLSNDLSDKMLKVEQEHKPAEAGKIIADISTSSLKAASIDGDVNENGAVMAGQVVPLVKEIKSCHDILEDVYTQGNKIIENLSLVHA